jgi:uncharacterized protein
MGEQENSKIARQAYENFNKGDMQGLLGLFTDDIQWHVPKTPNVPFTGDRQGLDQVRQFFEQMAQLQDIQKLEVTDSIAQGDKVVVRGNYAWRVKATGRDYKGDWAHVWTVRGGKLADFKEYTDTAASAAAFQQAQSAGQAKG